MAKKNHTPIQLKLPLDGVLEIYLTLGQVALVELVDADLAQVKWGARVTGMVDKYYAARSIGVAYSRNRFEIMHRVIMARVVGRELLSTELVDHINGNSLDNRRSNLRLATPTQNQANRKRNRKGSSPYKGVVKATGTKKWCARIFTNGKSKWLGSFDTAEEAHDAYCKAAREIHGEYANSD